MRKVIDAIDESSIMYQGTELKVEKGQEFKFMEKVYIGKYDKLPDAVRNGSFIITNADKETYQCELTAKKGTIATYTGKDGKEGPILSFKGLEIEFPGLSKACQKDLVDMLRPHK